MKISDFQLLKLPDEHRPARTQGFRRDVATYNHTCAACGIPIINRESTASLLPPILSHTTRATMRIHATVYLCQSCHWVFDHGLMAISADNYRAHLSAQLKAVDLEPRYFIRLRGSEIRLPTDPLLYPHPLALDWHRRPIFAS